MSKEAEQGKYKYGMVIDLDKCTGCGACVVACAAENNVTVRADESDKSRNISWLQMFKITNGKPFPETEISYIPRPCMHCHENNLRLGNIVADINGKEQVFSPGGLYHFQ